MVALAQALARDPQGNSRREDLTMTFASEFPDFDRIECAAMLIAAGWQDRSWHNEPCPSFVAGGAVMFVDYAAPEFREFPESEAVFSLHFLDHRGCFTDIPSVGYPTIEAALGALYEGLIGYDPFTDDPAISASEVAQTIVEYFAERNSSK
jgi:hypothetical protein